MSLQKWIGKKIKFYYSFIASLLDTSAEIWVFSGPAVVQPFTGGEKRGNASCRVGTNLLGKNLWMFFRRES